MTLIYGDDYARLMAQPIFYIRDNRIYAADEFFKLFPVEAGYISGNVSGRGNSVKESSFVDKEYVSDGGGYYYDDSREEGPFAKFLGWLMKVRCWGQKVPQNRH